MFVREVDLGRHVAVRPGSTAAVRTTLLPSKKRQLFKPLSPAPCPTPMLDLNRGYGNFSSRLHGGSHVPALWSLNHACP